jgi:hypothetical protein
MEKLINANEAADLLRVRPGTIYYWKFKQLIPCYKLKTGKKGKLLFKVSELCSFINQGKVKLNGKDL